MVMGIAPMIYGMSGSGKSTAMRNLDRKTTAVFNVAGKPLPFRDAFDMMVTVSDVDDIIKILKRNTTNCYVIDDSQYLMSFKLIDKWTEAGYQKYTRMAFMVDMPFISSILQSRSGLCSSAAGKIPSWKR